MTSSLIGILTFLVAGCASQPPTKPTALDPSNPHAPEAPPVVMTPLLEAGAAMPPAAQAAKEPKPTAMPAGHHRGDHGAQAATTDDHTTAAPMEMPMAGHAHEDGTGTDKPAVTYMCPMHPEISMPKPGACPKCGMKLVPRKPTATPGNQSTESPNAGETHEHDKSPSADQSAVYYTCPMHPEISSPKPGKCPKCGMKLVPRKPREQK